MTSTVASTGEAAEELAAPLDLLLTDAALGTTRRMLPNSSWVRFAASLAARPRVVARRGRELARELARIAAGTSDCAPSKRDRRFSDPAWTDNGVLRRIVQAYLATAETAELLVNDTGLEWRDGERMHFLVDNLVAAAAPSNNPLISPVAWKALIDTGGGSAVSGVSHLVRDLAKAPRIPSMIEPSAFQVGESVAATACYRSGQLLGGEDNRFILSTSGHIASMVNPPGNPRASYRLGRLAAAGPDEWLDTTPAEQGSWWPHYVAWLGERSGPDQDAPTALGCADFPPMDAAPGTYVFEG